MNKKPVYFSQVDPRWKNHPYTVDHDPKETTGTSGCGPTSASMVIATWCDPKVTPPQLCDLAIKFGDRTPNHGTEWEFFKHLAAHYKIHCTQTTSITDVVTALNAGKYVIASMGPGLFTKSGHYILLWGMNNGQISVLDPGHQALCKDHPLDVFKKEAKQYFIMSK